MGVFDEQDNLVGFVQTYNDVTLGTNKYFGNVKFSTDGMSELLPGHNYIAKACMYNTKTDQWDLVLSGNYINSLPFSVVKGDGCREAEQDGAQPYPNPTNGIVKIGLNGQNTKVDVTDASGRLILSQTCSSRDLQLDLTTYSSGMYYIRISNEKQVKTYKITKL